MQSAMAESKISKIILKIPKIPKISHYLQFQRQQLLKKYLKFGAILYEDVNSCSWAVNAAFRRKMAQHIFVIRAERVLNFSILYTHTPTQPHTHTYSPT
jgi:hypothetical protein